MPLTSSQAVLPVDAPSSHGEYLAPRAVFVRACNPSCLAALCLPAPPHVFSHVIFNPTSVQPHRPIHYSRPAHPAADVQSTGFRQGAQTAQGPARVQGAPCCPLASELNCMLLTSFKQRSCCASSLPHSHAAAPAEGLKPPPALCHARCRCQAAASRLRARSSTVATAASARSTACSQPSTWTAQASSSASATSKCCHRVRWEHMACCLHVARANRASVPWHAVLPLPACCLPRAMRRSAPYADGRPWRKLPLFISSHPPPAYTRTTREHARVHRRCSRFKPLDAYEGSRYCCSSCTVVTKARKEWNRVMRKAEAEAAAASISLNSLNSSEHQSVGSALDLGGAMMNLE